MDAAIRALEVTVPGARLEVRGGPARPPLEETSSVALFARAREIAGRQGWGPLLSAAVGGASDGNFTGGVGCRPWTDSAPSAAEHTPTMST